MNDNEDDFTCIVSGSTEAMLQFDSSLPADLRRVYVGGTCSCIVRDASMVVVDGPSRIEAYGSGVVRVCDLAYVEAHDDVAVEAFAPGHIVLFDRASVTFHPAGMTASVDTRGAAVMEVIGKNTRIRMLDKGKEPAT